MHGKGWLKRRRGFTLIELLVAMAVSLVVLMAVLQLFDNSRASYVIQEDVAELQQNVRIAKMFLERDIRMADAGIKELFQMDETCDIEDNPPSFGGVKVYPFEFEDNVDGSSGRAAGISDIVTGTDLLVVRYQNFGVGGCVASGGAVACDSFPQLSLTESMPDTSAVAVVSQDLQAGGDWDKTCTCNGITYTQPTPGMPFIVVSPDGSKSGVLFQTGTLPNSDKIQNGPQFTYNGVTYENKLLNTFPAGSTVNFFNPDSLYEAIYYIKNKDGIPCLVRDTGSGGQVIAEYVEDLQLSFALDADDDGTIDATLQSANMTDLQKRQVRLVNLSLVGRAAHAHRDFSGRRPALEDHGAGAADHYRRRVIKTTVKVRNL